MTPEAKVILKADDYGNAEPANAGINELVRRGLLSNVGVMIKFSGPKDRDDLLEAINHSPLKDTVGIVLHTNFQSGSPVSRAEDVSSLVQPNGRFKRPDPIRSSWEEYGKGIHSDDVRRELIAQIESFYQLFGHYPHALDSHNVILSVPPVDEIAIRIAEDLGVGLTYPYLYADHYGNGPLAAQTLHTDLQQEYKRRGIPTADHAFASYVMLEPTLDASVKKLEETLDGLKPGVTQVVFHPVHGDEAAYPRISSDTPEIDAGRRKDFNTLTHPRVEGIIADLRSAGRVTSYKELNSK